MEAGESLMPQAQQAGFKGTGLACVRANGDCDHHREDHSGKMSLVESNWLFVPCNTQQIGIDMVTKNAVVHTCSMYLHDDGLRCECSCGHRWVDANRSN